MSKYLPRVRNKNASHKQINTSEFLISDRCYLLTTVEHSKPVNPTPNAVGWCTDQQVNSVW